MRHLVTETRLAFREPVLRQADKQARLYLWGEEHDEHTTLEQKEVIESIVATDYDGRTLIELLQNGHDAHPRDRHDGKIEVVLHEDEGAHGVLYVANAGKPVGYRDFEDLCTLGLSSKRPDEGIGNKGVGFKSVLQLADSPEIYSASEEGAGRFDGYCLRFALPSDFDDIAARVAPDRADLADALRDSVAALKVPVPLDEVPERVATLGPAGFVTVVRLVLRSGQACARAREQMLELESSDVPFHLFLDRVATITLRRVTAEGGAPVSLSRRRAGKVGGGDLRGEHLELQDGSRFLLLRRSIPEDEVQRAIADSRVERQLSTAWERWKGDAQVAVALPLDAPLEDGRLYTFLPMGPRAPAPFSGFVNAPFFARLDRRSLDECVPLNDLLLTHVAHLCADALLRASAGEIELQPEQLIDLVTWIPAALPRLVAALAARNATLEELPLLRALGEPDAPVELRAACLWRSDGGCFTPAAVAQAGIQGLVDPSLDRHRRDRLITLADELSLSLVPDDDQVATFAEAYASALAAKPFEPGAWAAFFDDLALSVSDGKVLQGRRILVDEQARLLAAGDGEDGPVVFVARRDNEGDDPWISPPPAVASRLAFTHPAIPRRTEVRGPLGPGWRWLESHGLVEEYRTDAVLGLVGQTMQAADPTDDALLSSCLRFACEVWRGATRQIGAAALESSGLLVPAASGWVAPAAAVFGPGWGGPHKELDLLLSRLLRQVEGTAPSLVPVASGVLRAADTVVPGAGDREERRSFLESLGVRHGLHPRYFPSSRFRLPGRKLTDPTALTSFSIGVSATDEAIWRDVAARWPRSQPSFLTTRYTPRSGIARLPGHAEWASFDSETRRTYAELVLHGLDVWPDKAIEVQFGASSDVVSVGWPSFVASFLATAEWIPQATPGDRATVTLMPPAKAWWLREDETPDYLRAQPAALRKLATTKVLDRLGKIGVRFWDESGSAADRLEELAAVVDSPSRIRIRKAYEEAWRDMDSLDGIPPQRIVASRQGRLSVVDLSEDGEPIYVPVEDGAAKERLLVQAPVLMLPIRDRALAARAQQRLESAGPTRLRPTSTADIVVTADGVSAEHIRFCPLSELGGQWLPTLVLGVLEYGDSRFQRVSAAHLQQSGRALGDATIAVASEVAATVDGHAVVDTSGARSFLLDGTRIVAEAADDATPWQVLQAAAAAIAELVERPTTVTRELRLALIDLERRDPDDPLAADVAAVLGVHPDEITGLVDARTDVSDVIAVIACVDLRIAEELRDVAAHLDGHDALRRWLNERLAALAPGASAVLELAGQGDRLAVVRELDVALADANAAWRALGLAPLHNPNGHARAVQAYLQLHSAELHTRLRNRFAADMHAGAPLDEYLRLRELPGLTADPAWLDAHWDVSEELIEARVSAWLTAVAPAPAEPELDLPPVDELRQAGRRTLSSVVANVRVLVDAWLHRHAAGTGVRPGDLGAITEAMTIGGHMDFKRLGATDVVAWLNKYGQWPQGMPATTSRAALELSEADLEAARARLEQDRERHRRQTTYVEYGGRTYTEELADLRELADALRDELLSTPVPGAAETQVLVDIDTGRSDGPAWRRPARAGRASSPPPERIRTTGLAGEVVVGQWLRQQFGVSPEESWQSGYRFEVLGDGIGSDGHGYDFQVVTGQRTMLFEVKSSTGGSCEFTLGESEVRRAQSLALDEEYIVLFVPHVLDSARRRVVRLPNPFAYGGLRRYRLAGSAMRLQFQLATRASVPEPRVAEATRD